MLIEILDRLSERYLLSPYITDAAFWGLYSLIPAVILLAWTHGKPGKDRVTTAEKVGVPINIIATIGLLGIGTIKGVFRNGGEYRWRGAWRIRASIAASSSSGTVLNRRRRIKQKTLAERRRLYYQRKVA